MIIESELRRWAESRQAQRTTQSAVNAFAGRWNGGDVHRHFANALGAVPQQAGSIAPTLVALFEDERLLHALVDELSAEMRRDPWFDPPFPSMNSAVHTGLVIFDHDAVTISAGVTRISDLAAKKNARRGRASIGFTGQVNVIKFLKAGDARLSFWDAPIITGDFSAERAGECRRTGERQLKDGDTAIVDGRHQSYVIEHADSNILVLQGTIKADQAPLAVEYDADTHQYVGCSATADTASRIQMIATLVRKLGHKAAVPALAGLLDHPDFFVRWHVMRELIGLDPLAALPHLARMAENDPHPEARRAARATLDKIAARQQEESQPCPA